MHGSTSPAKKGVPSKSNPRHLPSQSQPRHVTWSRTRPTARRASSLAGSRPSSRSSDSTCIVEFHPWLNAVPAQDPSAPCRASNWAPQPSVATFARSAATSSSDSPIKSRITCQRIEGSLPSSSHCMTELFGFGACPLSGFRIFTSVCNSSKQILSSILQPAFLVWLLEFPFEYEILILYKDAGHR